MKVIIFGASGMVGQGVLRECLQAPDVQAVLVVGRSRLSLDHPKLRQLVQADLFDYSGVEDQLAGYDACFFSLGVSTSETDEAGFVRINHDLPLAAGRALVRRNPDMLFVYVSGGGTDTTEQGPVMWARVKGKTENSLRRLGFRGVYLFRPGFIVPMHGERSRTRMLRLLYIWFGWAFALLRRLMPGTILDTERMGQAMLEAARHGDGTHIAESAEIHQLARAARTPT
ncbi:NAD(P)H-binding protein (plasmid) [Cupriavidus pinatubonensis]|uniref:NAD(P)H-binding protein n=1 Tax=Cupriavidus pinatubonensis TaxID=248026 RepID=UPI001C72FAED|nr:NAD(P)H-binding protein [Cupriavidus pinatubonensis]QYY33975.1 NAD(P)H-binding protein [Cupriavidus pinatubonensis]